MTQSGNAADPTAPPEVSSGETAGCALDLNVDEVRELIGYAIESGVDRDVIDETVAALQSYEGSRNGATERRLAKSYAALVTHTAPVTGRTLIDSSTGHWKLLVLVNLALALLSVAVLNEILQTWLADQPTADAGWHLFLYNLQRHGLNEIAPLLWGGIGASIFLMKNIYDIVEERQFDLRKFKGWWLRIVIGAILAMVTLQIFNPESLRDEEELPLTAAAVAFLVGLGARVVYGALERLVNEMADRFRLERAGRAAETGNAGVREFLRQKIKEAEAKEDGQRTRILAELREELRTGSRGPKTPADDD